MDFFTVDGKKVISSVATRLGVALSSPFSQLTREEENMADRIFTMITSAEAGELRIHDYHKLGREDYRDDSDNESEWDYEEEEKEKELTKDMVSNYHRFLIFCRILVFSIDLYVFSSIKLSNTIDRVRREIFKEKECALLKACRIVSAGSRRKRFWIKLSDMEALVSSETLF